MQYIHLVGNISHTTVIRPNQQLVSAYKITSISLNFHGNLFPVCSLFTINSGTQAEKNSIYKKCASASDSGKESQHSNSDFILYVYLCFF